MNERYKQRPEITVPKNIDVPLAEKSILNNGVQVHVLDCCEQEVVRVSFVFHAGTTMQSMPFSASATANLLSEGTRDYTAHQIAEMLDYYGSYYDISLDRDYAVITFVSLSRFFDRTMDLAREILLGPAFDGNELRIYCDKRKHRLAVERSKIGQQARELFGSSLFGAAHPYGAAYSEDCYDRLSREDIVSLYRSLYVSGNCFVVASGRVGERERAAINALAGDIPKGEAADMPSFPSVHSDRNVFKPYEGALQSAVRIGRILFPKSHPDYIPTQVLTTVLGGYFGSRLVHNLREERGYTYGVFSGMVNLQYAGYMAVTTEVGAQATPDAVAQIFAEMQRLRDERVGEQELRMVRNIMTGEIMRILDGPFGIADVTIENIQNGVDNSFLNGYMEQILSITPEKLQEIAVKYLDPSEFTTVVVGDPALEEAFGTGSQMRPNRICK